MEIDVMAESMDGRLLLFGEAKWEKKSDVERLLHKLNLQAENFPKIANRKVILAVWCKQPTNNPDGSFVFTAKDVLDAVKK